MSTEPSGLERDRREQEPAAAADGAEGQRDFAPGAPVDRRGKVRRILLVSVAALVAAIAVGFAVRAIRAAWWPASVPHEAAELDTAHYLRPLETAADPETGEERAPFSGFAVSVETTPSDALVTIADVERGESPVIAGVECNPGSRVRIRAEKAGYRPAQAMTTCRLDTLVKLKLRLRR